MAFQIVGPVLTDTVAALGTVTLPQCSVVALDISGLTSETVSITASVDGTNFNTAKARPISVLTGALAASSDLGNGLYTLDVRAYKAIKATKSATSETAVIRVGIGA